MDERTRDADLDAVTHFNPAQSGLRLSSIESCLKSRLQGAGATTLTFFGCDSIRVVN